MYISPAALEEMMPAKSPSVLLDASGAFRAKPPLSRTPHADRQEVHTKIHLSSLPLTERKQKTDGKIKGWQREACGLHLHQPSWSCRVCFLLPGGPSAKSAFPKNLSCYPPLPTTEQHGGERDRGKEAKAQRKSRFSVSHFRTVQEEQFHPPRRICVMVARRTAAAQPCPGH